MKATEKYKTFWFLVFQKKISVSYFWRKLVQNLFSAYKILKIYMSPRKLLAANKS